MKKIVLAVGLALSLALTAGCANPRAIQNAVENAAESAQNYDWAKEMEKNQKIVVVSEEGAFESYELSEKSDLDAFGKLLGQNAEKWQMSSLPAKAEKKIRFELYQELTHTAGQKSDPENLKKTMVMTLYSEAHIQMEIGKLKLVFKIPQEQMDKLIDIATPQAA